ncbi:phage tail sheath subtilisin-like domain-containing protein [Micromonospora sp. DR5-3]|uniref:phage tail sheath subtilisin-like domain-containing protein n=1 Tax=unclassified Micromonospora TaxID=2617518 RepID=UPI0016522C6B|nr:MULTISPECIES: phage tail sheath subtilisin-like domain-containing protein [unclassified Micromonospora]MCW3819214.1 phage tail sheath subtilisin-like domain-containing protein [Micromonospora sp. DR5-3]
MAVQTTYPGVYIVEQMTSSHAIAGVSTSVTAFVGAARKGTPDVPTPIDSYADFVRQFGDPIDNGDNPMGHCVAHFFANGGSQAIVVRALAANALAAKLALPAVNGITVTLTARSRGAWANGTGTGAAQNGVFVEVAPAAINPSDRFTLVVTNWAPGTGSATLVARETWPELSMSPGNPRYVADVLAGSALVIAQVSGAETGAAAAGRSEGSKDLSAGVTGLPGRTLRISVDMGPAVDHVLWPDEDPADSHDVDDLITFINAATNGFPVTASKSSGKLVLTSKTTGPDSAVVVGLSGAGDASSMLGLGVAAGGKEISGSAADRPAVAAAKGLAGGIDGSAVGADSIVSPAEGQGMKALDVLNFPRFNLLCLPGVTTANVDEVNTALAYCADQNAFLLVDPDSSVTKANAAGKAALFAAQGAHGALYWPRLITADSTHAGLPPCGAVAGVMARTDGVRGVWKAPAGLTAGVAGAIGVAYPTSDPVSGALNPFGINVLRSFPGAGLVVWGARTLAGSDLRGDPFKYVPLRRLTDFIEASLYLGTQFAVFEPNDPVLWGQLRLAVTGFMRGLFRQGAFQQSESHAESDSFFVTCDSTVNPQTEIDLGRVNVVVGFAPLKPAEFVVVTITHIVNGEG